MNELSTIAKFIQATSAADSSMTSQFADRFYSEVIPAGESMVQPSLMFVTGSGKDTKGAFGTRLKTNNTFQIKAVIEGFDPAPLEIAADNIDRLFDWTNQIDPDAGRPKSQELFVDPDDDNKQIMIMSMTRVSPLRYCTLIDAVSYFHLGGEYEIEYYVVDSLQQAVVGQPTMTQAEYLQQQIDALSTKEGNLEMSFSNYQPSGLEPVILLTTAAPTVAMPTQNTVYKVAPTVNQLISLPAAPGVVNGFAPVLHFDLADLGSFTTGFTLNGSDTYVASTTGVSTATNIANAIASGAASISLRSLTAGKWSIE